MFKINYKNQIKFKDGFSLVELLIYIVLFSLISIFLISILNSFTKIQLRQVGINEVNNQISFVTSLIQENVRNASLIEMPDNLVTSTIFLRVSTSTLDPTLIYASGTKIFISQGNNAPLPLTDDNVKVDNFSAVKIPILGGSYVVQVNLSLSYNTPSILNKFSQSVQFAVSRISAATFDSSLYPASTTYLDLGSITTPWNNAYLRGDLNVGGTAYIGSGVPGNTAIKANGNIGFSSYTQGLILKASNGSCFLLGVNASGTIITSLVTCP